jgi:hypothetical protein
MRDELIAYHQERYEHFKKQSEMFYAVYNQDTKMSREEYVELAVAWNNAESSCAEFDEATSPYIPVYLKQKGMWHKAVIDWANSLVKPDDNVCDLFIMNGA